MLPIDVEDNVATEVALENLATSVQDSAQNASLDTTKADNRQSIALTISPLKPEDIWALLSSKWFGLTYLPSSHI